MRPWYLSLHEHNIFSKGPKCQCNALHVIQPSLHSMLTVPRSFSVPNSRVCPLVIKVFPHCIPFYLDVAHERIDTRFSLPAQLQRSRSGAGKLRNEASQLYISFWNTWVMNLKQLLKDGSGHIFERYDILFKNTPTSKLKETLHTHPVDGSSHVSRPPPLRSV